MRKRILILGSEGMVGHVFACTLRNLSERYEVFDINRGGQFIHPTLLLEATEFKELEKYYQATKPDCIVNCIGLLNQSAEKRPDEAILINSYLPHFLEQLTANSKCKVIHISTDCVFSGHRGGYIESDIKDGEGFYAQSKALGEIINKKDLTIRTSLIGPELKKEGIGLFNWFANQQGKINGYSEVPWTGVTSVEIAKAIIKAIEQDITGLYHLVNGEKIPKFNLLKIFKQIFPSSAVEEIIPNLEVTHDKSLINTRKDFNFVVASYETMIIEMREWMIANKELYPHYAILLNQ